MSGFAPIYGQNIVINNISTEGAGLTDLSIRYTAAPRAAMWVLNRSADPDLADDIFYVAAEGGGLWIRNTSLGAPGANFQTIWYVNYNTGENDADGLTPSTAVKSLNEIQARWGKQVIDGLITPLVTIHVAGNSSANHVISPVVSNTVIINITGTRTNTPGLSGTLTTYQNWDSSTKTQCEFSWSGLSGTWTAGQFLALPSLGNVSVIAGKDIGSKTAVSCDAFDVDGLFSTPGAAVAFQGYNFNALSGKMVLAPSGKGVIIMQDLELGQNDSLDLHWIVVGGNDGGQVTFSGCRLYGVDAYNTVLTAASGCHIIGWRNYGRDLVSSTVHDTIGGAVYRVHENAFSDIIDHVLLLGLPSIDESGMLLIESDCSTYNASGWLVRGKARIDGSFWAKNAGTGGNVLKTEAGGVVVYANASNIGSTGTTPTNLYAVPGSASSSLPLVATARLSGIVQL